MTGRHGQNKFSISSMSSIDLGSLTISDGVQTLGSLPPTKEDMMEVIDIAHHFFLIIRNGALFEFGFYSEDPKVVDLGTGTGIWAVQVAKLGCTVHAVDSDRLQPDNFPSNIRMYHADIEKLQDEVWKSLAKTNLVHVRMLFGAVRSWLGIYERAFKCLLPDGYIQHSEIDWTPKGVDPASALKKWSDNYLMGTDYLGRTARVNSSETRRLMERAGFTDFAERCITCYLVPQKEPSEFSSRNSDEYRLQSEAPNWLNVLFQRSLTALSMVPMSEGLGMPLSDIEQLCQAAKEESLRRTCPAKFDVYIWTGVRPRNT